MWSVMEKLKQLEGLYLNQIKEIIFRVFSKQFVQKNMYQSIFLLDKIR